MAPKMLVFSVLSLSLLQIADAGQRSATGTGNSVSAASVIKEMNLARTEPALYAGFLQEMRPHFNGNILAMPGRTMLRTKEGAGAVDEAISFLRSTPARAPLALSHGMCRGAADHCADQASGGFGHGGSDRSNPAERMSRYGSWSTLWGENVSYGKTTAREIVIALIIDDGLSGRKHRQNIFNPTFNYAGAAFGPHATYRTVCSIDFAGGYAEAGAEASGTLVARNF
jgi:uncharacterized protein YkwD